MDKVNILILLEELMKEDLKKVKDMEKVFIHTLVEIYMNVILINAEEHENGSMSANFGKVVIRGNNVLFINIRPDILM